MAARPSGVSWSRARREQHLGFEHEAVADDADVLAVLQELAQAAEEVGAVALQLLHLAGERRVEARAEILDARLALGVLLFGGLQRVVEGGNLPAQRQQLLIEEIDLGQRLVRRPSSGFRGRLARPEMRASAAFAASSPESAEPDSCVFSSRSVDSVACSAASSSPLDLLLPFSSDSRLVSSVICSVSLLQRGVLAARLLAGEILRQHEDRHQEGDDEQQRRQHVDVARPEQAVVAAVPARRPPAMRYPLRRILTASSFSALATSDCCEACSSTHSRTTFCSARIWVTS